MRHRWLILIVAAVIWAWAMNTSHCQVPDGTIVFSSKKGVIGRIAKRLTGGDQYTHVGIVLSGRVYESDWPRATSTPVSRYGKRRTTNDYYVPAVSLTSQQISAMRHQAQAMIGTPYRLNAYFHPGRESKGMWCSPYVGHTLNAAGLGLTRHDMHEPQNVKARLGSHWRFSHRVKR